MKTSEMTLKLKSNLYVGTVNIFLIFYTDHVIAYARLCNKEIYYNISLVPSIRSYVSLF